MESKPRSGVIIQLSEGRFSTLARHQNWQEKLVNIRSPRLCFTALIALFLATLSSRGAVTIASGLATAGADFTSGLSQSSPPTGPISPDVFYDSRNVVSTPSESQRPRHAGPPFRPFLDHHVAFAHGVHHAAGVDFLRKTL